MPEQLSPLVSRYEKSSCTSRALIDVRVLDHLIVAGSDVTSLAEWGLV